MNLTIPEETGEPDHLTCLLRNLYVHQAATVRTGHEKTDWFKTGIEVRQGCILSPCLFNFYAEYIMQNASLDESQAGIKISWRNIITSDIQMAPPFGLNNEVELKNLLMKVTEESEKLT